MPNDTYIHMLKDAYLHMLKGTYIHTQMHTHTDIPITYPSLYQLYADKEKNIERIMIIYLSACVYQFVCFSKLRDTQTRQTTTGLVIFTIILEQKCKIKLLVKKINK